MNLTDHTYQIIEIGHPVLGQIAAPVVDFSSVEMQQHIDAMFDLMNQHGGVGIAAPQIGVSLQMMIIASRPNPRYPSAPEMEPLLLMNPRIVQQSDQCVEDWEGCLSVPGIRGRVSRPDSVGIEYQDADGDLMSRRLEGFPARVFLHEFDHLLGKTFLDRVASPAALFSEKEYLKQVSATESEC